MAAEALDTSSSSLGTGGTGGSTKQSANYSVQTVTTTDPITGQPVTVRYIIGPDGSRQPDLSDPATKQAFDHFDQKTKGDLSNGPQSSVLPSASSTWNTTGQGVGGVAGTIFAPFEPMIHGDANYNATGFGGFKTVLDNSGKIDLNSNTGWNSNTGTPGTSGSGGSGGGGGSLSDQVNAIANKAYGYATENRDFQMQGMNAANAALDPAKASYAGMYGPGGTLTGPGTGEQAFGQVGQNILNPSKQGDVYANLSGQLSGPNQGTQAFGQVGSQFLNPTASGGAYDSAQGYLSGQSPGMQAFGNVAGQLGGPTLSQQTYGQYANQLGQQSAGEQRYNQTQGQYNDNKLNQSYGSLMSKYDAPTNLQQNLGTIAGGYAQPSASQQTFQQQSGQLGGPGSLEKFAASDLAGDNPYYKQLQEQQAADIDSSFNARGGYNSGAAMKAQALAASNLRAQQYQQEGQLQGQAQQAMQSRLGQQQSAAGLSDTARYAGLAGQANTLGAADAQRLAATNAETGLAGAASGMDLSYLQGGQAAANQAGAASLARTQAGIGLTQGTDATNLAQNLGYVGAANQAGAGQVAQYSALGNLAQNKDAAAQAQLNNYLGNARSTDAGQLAQYGLLNNMASGLDATQQQQYMNYLNQAASMQGLAQQRQQQGFTDAAAIGAQQGAQTLQGYGKAGDQYASMIGAGMGAQLNAAQLAAQQQQNQAQNNLGLLDLAVKGYTAYATGGASLLANQQKMQQPSYTTGTNGAPILD